MLEDGRVDKGDYMTMHASGSAFLAPVVVSTGDQS